MGVIRCLDGELLIGLYNFSDEPKVARALHSEAKYLNLMTGDIMHISEITVPAQGFYWLKRI